MKNDYDDLVIDICMPEVWIIEDVSGTIEDSSWTSRRRVEDISKMLEDTFKAIEDVSTSSQCRSRTT